ncbi:MAG: hypothetical protein D3914_11365 [Candidatus Electrothrix sp. LOE2]|nr:hypothetical protein [Candidatus Electrothrix sp. LOE2]
MHSVDKRQFFSFFQLFLCRIPPVPGNDKERALKKSIINPVLLSKKKPLFSLREKRRPFSLFPADKISEKPPFLLDKRRRPVV